MTTVLTSWIHPGSEFWRKLSPTPPAGNWWKSSGTSSAFFSARTRPVRTRCCCRTRCCFQQDPKFHPRPSSRSWDLWCRSWEASRPPWTRRRVYCLRRLPSWAMCLCCSPRCLDFPRPLRSDFSNWSSDRWPTSCNLNVKKQFDYWFIEYIRQDKNHRRYDKNLRHVNYNCKTYIQ